jgi:hypothetical protein
MSRLCSSVVSRWMSRGQLGVCLELQFLLGEVVIRLGPLELRLPVLADHDERGQEDRLQRHDQR